MLSKKDAGEKTGLIRGPRLGFSSILLMGATLNWLLLSYFEYHLPDLKRFMLLHHLTPAFPADSFYWLFSTVAQSMGAIFGIGGLFAAYIIQLANSNLGDATRRAKEHLALDHDKRWEVKVVKGAIAKHLGEHAKPGSYEETWTMRAGRLKLEIEKAEKFKNKSVESFKNVSIYLTVVLALSVIALPFARHLTSLAFGFLFSAFLMALVIITLIKSYQFILNAVTGPKD